MGDFVKRALTRTISVKGSHGRTQEIEIPPNQKIVYGIYFAIASLLSLTALEITYMVVVRAFSTEIFAAITLVIGTILGAFFGQKA